MTDRRDPPMPVRATVAGTVRETGMYSQRGEPDEIPVARTDFRDVMGESVTMDFPPELALDLARQLLAFVAQVGVRGQ